jgi:hypothetical protein
MNQKELNPYSQISFKCDNCEEKYEQRTAYSLAPSLAQLSQYPTYCINCIRFTEEELEELTLSKTIPNSQPRTKPKKWAAPPREASENLQSLDLDKRSLTRTGRIHQLGTRVRKEFLEQLKTIAYEERLKYVEVLEKSLECYERHRKSNVKN